MAALHHPLPAHPPPAPRTRRPAADVRPASVARAVGPAPVADALRPAVGAPAPGDLPVPCGEPQGVSAGPARRALRNDSVPPVTAATTVTVATAVSAVGP